jgi:hypothetical protein
MDECSDHEHLHEARNEAERNTSLCELRPLKGHCQMYGSWMKILGSKRLTVSKYFQSFEPTGKEPQ